jgi:nucleoid DNA-binding protein
MTNLTKLANRVYEKDSRLKHFLYKYEFQGIVKKIFEEVKQISLEELDTCRISNFGIFSPKKYSGISPLNKKPYNTTTINFKLHKKYRIKG